MPVAFKLMTIPITIDNLSFTYPSGVTALADISLAIAPGESVALIGQNGAGKTTLARHLNGLLRPTRGSVRIGDLDTRHAAVAQLARRVGYVFQHPEHQIFKSRVRDEVAYGPRNLGVSHAEIEERVRQALAATGIADLADAHPHDLMPSLRKRVAIASVLAMDTPIVVLDEPTTGQDAPGVALIGALVERLTAAGRTVITISHDIDFCADHCRRIVVMGQGRVLLDGPREVVFAQPDVLARTAVEPPQLARLAARLGLPPVWAIEPLLDALASSRRDG
jgi:energy-coupling factor transport system ATP-binding protein